MTAAGTEELLRERARELARPRDATEAPRDVRTVLRFRLRDAGYAVPLHDVRHVVPLRGAARLPAAARPLVALTAVVGDIVPVVDIDSASSGGAAWAIAVEVDGVVVCLPADEVTGLTELAGTDVTARDPSDVAVGYTREVTRTGDAVIDVRSLVAVLTGDRAGGTGRAPAPRDEQRATE